MAGGGDQSANAVGVGAVSAGTVALSLGTSGVIFATTEQPIHEPHGRVHAFCHAVPGRWHLMSVMLSAAGSLRWYRDALAPGMPFGELVEEAAAAPAGSDGLRFLPYLTGERSPHVDPLARGAFVGLIASHERRHLTRSVLEGVAFGLRDGLASMLDAGMPMPTQIRASGGGTVSPLWRQILADVLGAEIATVNTSEGAAYGAGIAGRRRGGLVPSVEAAAAALRHRHAGRGAGPGRCRVCRGLRHVPRPVSRAGAHLPAPDRLRASRRSAAQLDGRLVLLGDLVGLLAQDDHAQHVVRGDGRLVDGVDDPAVVHDADPIGQVEDVVDVVADEEDADALVLELADEVADLGGLGRAEGGGGLVHDQDPGVEMDRPGDGHGLSLAAGEGLDGR